MSRFERCRIKLGQTIWTVLAQFRAVMMATQENLILDQVLLQSAAIFAYLNTYCNNSPSIGRRHTEIRFYSIFDVCKSRLRY